MNIDLHCHSNVSDGALAPAEVARRAARSGVQVWALTDHDQLGGLGEAREAARAEGMHFIDGVEISVTWRGSTVHVVGLRIDPASETLAGGLACVRSGRIERAKQMARELKASGIEGAFEGALRHAENPAMVSRTHFARFLAEIGAVAGTRDAFRKYLVPGKPGYVPHQWAALADAVGWIRAAEGHAVLAHPGRYGLSAAAMDALLGEFRDAGGEAIEVVTASHSPDQVRHFGAIAAQHDFAASRGSDFHGPGEGAELGSLPALDAALRPVWRDWQL
jgi:predicted metal-dependent phosphoesterase TrpH